MNGVVDFLALAPVPAGSFPPVEMGGDWPSEAVVTRTRPELVPTPDWDRSAFANEVLRPHGIDEGLMARGPVPVPGAMYLISLARGVGDRAFPARIGAVVRVAQEELAPLLGRALWLSTQPNLAGLSPRQRRVLDCLLDGDGEKQAAARVGLHVTTVHDHVRRLYAHFGVNSRAELLAYFLRRHRPGA